MSPPPHHSGLSRICSFSLFSLHLEQPNIFPYERFHSVKCTFTNTIYSSNQHFFLVVPLLHVKKSLSPSDLGKLFFNMQFSPQNSQILVMTKNKNDHQFPHMQRMLFPTSHSLYSVASHLTVSQNVRSMSPKPVKVSRNALGPIVLFFVCHVL